MPFLTSHPSSPCSRIKLANGNVEIYFGNISIEVNSAGHDLFQQVSNGIKAGDQRVNGKQIREATSFLAKVSFDLETKLETFPEGDVNITYYAKAMGKRRIAKKNWKLMQARKRGTKQS